MSVWLQTRDVMARIENIKDKALMAPRSSRILLEEYPVSQATAPGVKPRRTMSDAATRRAKDISNSNEWFIRFTDCTIRCVKIRETDLAGGFSRQKEKQGKQGKMKKGKVRNVYRFVKVEKWEMRDASGGAGFVSKEDISRAAGYDHALLETSEEEYEDEQDDAESRMR